MSDGLIIKDLEEGLALAAYAVLRYGERYAPIFERMEREVDEARRPNSVVSRATRVLEAQTIEVKAIRSSQRCLLASDSPAP